MAHPRRRRDAGGRVLGPRLDDLWRARVLEHGRHAGGCRGHRHDWADPGKACVQAHRGFHGCALGHDDMSTFADHTRSIRRAAVSLFLAAAAYESIARSGVFPPSLLPSLVAVAGALVDGVLDGSLPAHALATLYRVLMGVGLAIAFGLP